MQNSSLDNLIKASLNPIGGGFRARADSLNQISQQQFGRKRAMTIDGPSKANYAPLGASKNSAFRTFKSIPQGIPTVIQDTKADAIMQSEAQKADASLVKRKRTNQEMHKDFLPQSSQLTLSPNDDFSGRKRARSF
jgi:hypothetical protein